MSTSSFRTFFTSTPQRIGAAILLCIGDKIFRNLLLGRRRHRVGIRKFHARKSIMPGRTDWQPESPISRNASVPRCGAAQARHEARRTCVKCSLMATPAWPPPTTSVSTSSTDISASICSHLEIFADATGVCSFGFRGGTGLRKLRFHVAMVRLSLNAGRDRRQAKRRLLQGDEEQRYQGGTV